MAIDRPLARRFDRLSPAARPAVGWLATPVAFVVFVVVALVARIWLGRKVPTPWILVDELIYSEEAKSFAAGGDFMLRGVAGPDVGKVYPALISPGWAFDSTATSYGVAKAINAAAMTMVVVPVYFWARRLVAPGYAVLAAVLTLALPAFVYSGTLITENVFFPAFVLSCFLLALVLEVPTMPRQAAMLVVFALTVAIRVQGVVLVPILVVASLVKILLDLQAAATPVRLQPVVRALRPFAASLALIGAAALLYVAWKVVHGAPLRSGLGVYAGVGTDVYSARDALRWVLYHSAEISLAVGVIPLSAFVVLFGLAWRRGARAGPAERAFLATVAAAVFLLVIEVGVFASRFAIRIEERNMFHVAPLLLLALVVWLDRGLPRPPALTAVAAILPGALLLTLPLERLLNVSILSDTFGLIPFYRLISKLNGGFDEMRLVLAAGLLAAGLLFAVLSRRWATVAVPLAVGAFLIGSSWVVFGSTRDFARGTDNLVAASANRDWVDDVVGRNEHVPFVFVNSPDVSTESGILWQTEFWNRSVDRVYGLGAQETSGLPELIATPDASGRIRVDDSRTPRYAVAPLDVELAGSRVATTPRLALYRLAGAPRLAATTAGLYADGWSGPDAEYLRYSPAGQIRVDVSRAGWRGPDAPGNVRVEVARLSGSVVASRRWVVHSGATRTFAFPAPEAPFRVRVHIDPTFSPSQFGQSDTRQLGAQVQFAASS